MNTQADSDQQKAAPLPLVRITRDPPVMQGKACIRGMRVTVGRIVGQVGAGGLKIPVSAQQRLPVRFCPCNHKLTPDSRAKALRSS